MPSETEKRSKKLGRGGEDCGRDTAQRQELETGGHRLRGQAVELSGTTPTGLILFEKFSHGCRLRADT